MPPQHASPIDFSAGASRSRSPVTGAAVKLDAPKRMAIAGRYGQALVANRHARHHQPLASRVRSSSHLLPFRGEDAEARACMHACRPDSRVVVACTLE